MADIRHTMSLDDRPFSAALKRSEQRAAAMTQRTSQRMEGMGHSIQRNVMGLNRLTKAYLGLNLMRAPIRFATGSMRELADVTNDASGAFDRLADAWQAVKLGAALSTDTNALGRAMEWIRDHAGGNAARPLQASQAARLAAAVASDTRADTLRSRGDIRGSERMVENQRHIEAIEGMQRAQRRLRRLGFGGMADRMTTNERERHAARLDEVDRHEAERRLSKMRSRMGEDAAARPSLPSGAIVGRADRELRFNATQRSAQAVQVDEEKKHTALLAKILAAIKSGTGATFGP